MNPQRLNKLAKMLGISAVVFFSVSCKEESAQIGQPAPEIAAFDLQGNKASLRRLAGQNRTHQLLVGNLWRLHCRIKNLAAMGGKIPEPSATDRHEYRRRKGRHTSDCHQTTTHFAGV